MSALLELRDTLLAIAHPERILRLADDYLARFEVLGDDFILPAEHAVVKPILDFYVGDLTGWVKFVRNVRDRLDPQSAEFREVHEFYKTLNVRAIQRRTRAAIDAATASAIRLGLIQDKRADKERYARRCIQAWKLRKDAMLDSVRRASPTGRVSVSHREELLKEFWDQIAEEANSGEVPQP